ncbi:hypothetical protein KDA82_40120, partial [Streptomyces daliensis]|nr:hypothetical protein [Streptomyces daliensis]
GTAVPGPLDEGDVSHGGAPGTVPGTAMEQYQGAGQGSGRRARRALSAPEDGGQVPDAEGPGTMLPEQAQPGTGRRGRRAP